MTASAVVVLPDPGLADEADAPAFIDRQVKVAHRVN